MYLEDFNIIELTESTIPAFSAQTLMSSDILNTLYDMPDLIEQERLKGLMLTQAKKKRCYTELKKVLKTYDIAQKKLLRDSYAHIDNVNDITVQLSKDGNDKVANNIYNYKTILAEDPIFKDMTYNLMSRLPEIRGRKWEDADDSKTRMYIERKYSIYSPQKLEDAIKILFSERGYHPLKDIIESVEWDGVERIENMLIKYMIADDNDYSREVSRLVFAGGIHRIYNPGCKFDYVPVLIGTHQGEGKSTFIRWLSLDEEYYRTISTIENKEGIEILEGAWICEIDELLALTKTKDVEAVKSYITRQVDIYRKAYERRPGPQPRQCIFIGSSNKSQFLTDKSGNRRFLPIRVTQQGEVLYAYEEECKADILQCWAEALYKYNQGELPAFPKLSLKQAILEQQNSAVEDDYRVGMIEEYIRKWNCEHVCVLEIWERALHRDPERYSRRDGNEIVMILESIFRFHPCGRIRREEYGQQRHWSCK